MTTMIVVIHEHDPYDQSEPRQFRYPEWHLVLEIPTLCNNTIVKFFVRFRLHHQNLIFPIILLT